ncbi:hypothetical protein [Aminobacter sp. HY435]|uniref:hypothetical protein n=1 Tax=Aminobacter sp. HY435 TaxID=2970917 RepID=UPI0022B9D349|nr:hypothetical protein [Aminobacter sp. HY435]
MGHALARAMERSVISGVVYGKSKPETAMYELFHALLASPWGDPPGDDDAAIVAQATAIELPAPDLDRCFEAVEQQLFDQP